jgi:hypothetical protein
MIRLCLLHAVVWSQIRSSPSAGSASATALNVTQGFIRAELLDRQRSPVMTGPIALALAIAINKQPANAVRAK